MNEDAQINAAALIAPPALIAIARRITFAPARGGAGFVSFRVGQSRASKRAARVTLNGSHGTY
jgi:hypothetical protein